MMKLGVIGGGVVGRATARSYLEHAEVRVFDLVKERRSHSLAEVLECELVFICLPTPQTENELKPDLRIVDGFFDCLAGSDICLVLRSTVPIGATRRLRDRFRLSNLVHSPEFLTARCAMTDAQMPARNIIGGPLCEGNVRLGHLYQSRFPGVPLFRCTSDESEAAKLFQNGFFGVKVSYFNECRTLADKLGLSWDAIMEMIMADGRIAHSHTKVPGPDGKFGWGGACIGKDSASLIALLEDNGLSAAVTRAAGERNIKDRERPSCP